MAGKISSASRRVLIVTEDDDVGDPLETLLRRAGCAVESAGGADGAAILRSGAPDALILDQDLPRDRYQAILEAIAPNVGAASFPLLILGGGAAPALPEGWHEDAWRSVARPPQPGEIVTALALLERLSFYRRYRVLVHDLAQPVTTLHALSRTLARHPPDDESARQSLDLLGREADRLMTLLENFQRNRARS